MSVFGRKCPKCGAFTPGKQRYCGSCGCDMEAWEAENVPAIERLRPVRPARKDAPEWTDETPRETEKPRPTQTARVAPDSAPAQMVRPLRESPTEQPAHAAPEGESLISRLRRWRRGLQKKDVIKLVCIAAAALVILIAAIALIVRMNRPAAPAPSEDADADRTVHTIEVELETPTPSPAPTATPVPTEPPAAATAAPATPGYVVSEVTGYVYAIPAALPIRSGPGAEYEIIATVEQNTALLRTGVLDGWTRVLIDGREGYVPHDQIGMEPVTTPEPTPLPELDFEVDDMDDTVVVDGGANLRIGPGSDYDVYDYVSDGKTLHRTGVIDGWSQVEYDGRRVYVFSELLRQEDGDGPGETERETPAADPSRTESASGTVTLRMNANIRTGPGTEYDIIGLADGGSTLEVSELTDGWYKVNFLGETGYVLASLTE